MTLIEDIFNRVKTDWEYVTNSKFKGMIQSLGSVFSTHLYDFTNKLKFIEKQAFIETADETYLLLHAGNMVQPFGKSKSQGYVVVYGEVSSTIPSNEKLKTDSKYYTLLSDVVVESKILNGNLVLTDTLGEVTIDHNITSCIAKVNGIEKTITAIDTNTLSFDATDMTDGQLIVIEVNCSNPVPIISDDGGSEYNLAMNTELELITIEAGINKIVAVSTSGGGDEESLAEYRTRVKTFIREPIAPFNRSNINNEISKIRTLRYFWQKANSSSLQIIAINNNDTLDENEKETIKEKLTAILPADLDDSFILEPIAPNINDITIVLSDFLPADLKLMNIVKDNLIYVFNQAYFEKAITESEIESIVYNSSTDSQTVQSFTVSSGTADLQDNTLNRVIDVQFV